MMKDWARGFITDVLLKPSSINVCLMRKKELDTNSSLLKHFAKVAGGGVGVIVDSSITLAAGYFVTQIPPDLYWQTIISAFAVASAGCTYEGFKELKKSYASMNAAIHS